MTLLKVPAKHEYRLWIMKPYCKPLQWDEMCILFNAVKSELDVDLAPGVDSSDDAVKEKPILERTRKGI